MSQDPSRDSSRPRLESDPNPPLPQDEFPEYPLSTVVEPRADGSRRCIFYPEEEDDVVAETQWIATDNDSVVSISQWR